VIERKDYGIIYRHGAAGKETVPASTRLGGGSDGVGDVVMLFGRTEEIAEYSMGDGTWVSELQVQENDLYKLPPEDEDDDQNLDIEDEDDDQNLDIVKIMPSTNPRFTLVAYSDASFAVGELKQSITAFLVMVNGTPLL
jgi:hypothetical protein